MHHLTLLHPSASSCHHLAVHISHEVEATLQAFRRNAQPRRRRAVKDNELRLDEDVAVDGKADTRVGLETAEACYDQVNIQ
jgi:hypothetical protein